MYTLSPHINTIVSVFKGFYKVYSAVELLLILKTVASQLLGDNYSYLGMRKIETTSRHKLLCNVSRPSQYLNYM